MNVSLCEQYPDWLWEVPLQAARLEDMSQDDPMYWRKFNKLRCQKNNDDKKQAKK